jgi:hypothetical protein
MCESAWGPRPGSAARLNAGSVSGSRLGCPNLAPNLVPIRLYRQLGDAPDFQMDGENLADNLRLFRAWNQLSGFQVIAERHEASHPHTFLVGCGDLVPNPLSCHLPFELREGERNIKCESAHRRGGVELLSDGYEGDSSGIKGFNNIGKIGQATRQTVNFVHDNNVYFVGFNVFQQTRESSRMFP